MVIIHELLKVFAIDFQYLLIISIVSKLDSFTQLFEVVGSSFHLTSYSY
jgi:hypothetical protein